MCPESLSERLEEDQN